MSGSPRRWLGLRLRTLVWLILLTTIGLSVYSYWSDYADRAAQRERELLSPARGAECTVVLRRDAPRPLELGGVASSVSGKFRMMNEQWIVLDGATGDLPQQWIPRENVLLIQVSGS